MFDSSDTICLAFHPIGMIYMFDQSSKCKIMQGAQFAKVQNYAKHKIMLDGKICKVQHCAKHNIVQIATLYKVQSFAKCKTMQSKVCKVQISKNPKGCLKPLCK